MNQWNIYVQLLPSWFKVDSPPQPTLVQPEPLWPVGFISHHHRLSFLPVVPPPFHLISDTSDIPSNLLTSRLFCVSPSPCVRLSGCSYIFLCLCRVEILFSTGLSSFFFLLSLLYVCFPHESQVSHFIVSYSRLFLCLFPPKTPSGGLLRHFFLE